jgi:DNA invertase Pin-like site-specific DNA recombinase
MLAIVVAFSYIRFSSKKQELGDSRRRQIDLAVAYCKRRGWKLSPKTFEDLGVSAFKGKNALVGNLGEFLKAIESGTVKPGSVLIVESLDRISREGIDAGWDLIKKILKSDIRIVTLSPEREFDREATRSLSKGALEIQLILERAAEESERKSGLLAAVRAQERKRLRKTRKVAWINKDGDKKRHRLPAWIAEEGDKPVLIPERVAIIKLIFGLAASGYGVPAIIAKLKKDGVPPFGRKAKWSRSYVGLLLRDRRVLGEFQPHKGKAKDGQPVLNFFPAAISQKEWQAARAGVQQRRRHLGGISKARCNIFAGILQHARDGDSYYMTTRLSRSPTKADTKFQILVNKASEEGTARGYSVPYGPFEDVVLECLLEINVREVLGRPAGKANPLDALEKELDGIRAEQEDIADTLMKGKVKALVPVLEAKAAVLEAQAKELEAKVEAAQLEAANPLEDSWRDAQGQMKALKTAANPEDARLRLRSALRRICEVAMILIVPRGCARLAAVQFHFRKGSPRSYLVYYHPAAKRFGKATPALCCTMALADPQLGRLDLRKPEHAARMETFLADVPLA